MRKSAIHYSSELMIKEGHLEQFRAVVARFLAALKETESQTVEYVAYISTDGKRCVVDQWYADINALKSHMSGVSIQLSTGPSGAMDQGLFAHADLVRIWLYAGGEDPEVKKLLTIPGAEDLLVVGSAFGGFDRTSGVDIVPKETPADWRNP